MTREKALKLAGAMLQDQHRLEGERIWVQKTLADAIAVSDAAEKACPVYAGRIAANDKCPLCGAMATETCFRIAAADYRAMHMVRAVYKELSA